ncbi:MAG: hypothetical protein OXF64_04380, partial [bacterium]|nr:hypothetical protein [bacterium]
MIADRSDTTTAVEAWEAWCALLERMGREVVAAPYPTGDGAELEMLEHLADNAVAFLDWEVLHADPARPMFSRQNDLITQWRYTLSALGPPHWVIR